MKRHVAALTCTFCLSAFALEDGELDRYMEWQDRRDYQQRREESNHRNQDFMNSLFDAQQDSINNAAQAAMRQAKDNPCFETELAALKACTWPYIGSLPGVEEQYFAQRRALCEKWGVTSDDSEDRRELSNLQAEKERAMKEFSDGMRNWMDDYARKNMGIDLRGNRKPAGPRGAGCGATPRPPKPPKPPKPTTEEVMDAAQSGLALASSIAASTTDNGAGDCGGGAFGSVLTEMPRDIGYAVVPQMPATRPGQRHPLAGNVVLSRLMEWEPEPGYDWNIPEERRSADFDWVGAGVHWVPGKEHPEHPHVVAGGKEGTWEPAQGWRFASHRNDDWAVVPK